MQPDMIFFYLEGIPPFTVQRDALVSPSLKYTISENVHLNFTAQYLLNN